MVTMLVDVSRIAYRIYSGYTEREITLLIDQDGNQI
jgi:hypothetical protein